MFAQLSIGLHCNWLSLSTSKSVSNNETDSLFTTSSKCVDGVTKSALLKWLAIADVKTNSRLSCYTIRGTKKIPVTAEYKKRK